MKSILLIFLSLLPFSSAFAQAFQTGNTTITFNDPSRSNRAIATDIYYPATSSGTNVPPGGNPGQKFPVIVFGHGFVMTVNAYQNIWSALVPQGYIVALPKTEGGLLPDHNNFAKDLAFVAGALKSAGNTAGNLLYNKVAANSCVMGHSMGGGVAFLAIQYNPDITALAALAPAQTNPSASAAAQSHALPTLIFAGGNDCVTPAAQHSQLIYTSSSSSCKHYINLTGGSHCQFANSNFNCSLGEASCSPGPAISRAAQQALVNTYLLPWLNFRLKNDCQGWYGFQSSISTDPAISYLQSCNNPNTCSAPVNRQTKNITNNSAVLTWKKPVCAYRYEVRYRAYLVNTNSWNTINGLIAPRCTLNNLLPGTVYEWQVRTQCDSAGSSFSNWGTMKQFTTASPRSGINSDIESEAFSFTILPNPNSGVFRIIIEEGSMDRTYEAELINVQGRSISFKFNPENIQADHLDFECPPLPAGIYFLRLHDGVSTQSRKLLIQ
ncbi:MAG: alpha/beta hydrolase [Bacteroidia bacterium]|nr:alpha/beta hydrolase [Bacteroidia bacterium]